jgi:hypothetical protein
MSLRRPTRRAFVQGFGVVGVGLLQHGLSEPGDVEGQNRVIERRSAETEEDEHGRDHPCQH